MVYTAPTVLLMSTGRTYEAQAPAEEAVTLYRTLAGEDPDAYALARALNVLTIENDELRRKANRAAPPMGPRPLA
jgi:hypothetical protein